MNDELNSERENKIRLQKKKKKTYSMADLAYASYCVL